jgi:hypothetical protein
MDNFDAKLLSNRSLCWVRMGHGEWAYDDADKCQELRPKWAKSHYRLGVALMCMKVRAIEELTLKIPFVPLISVTTLFLRVFVFDPAMCLP